MKKTIMISLLCLTAIGSYAQNNDMEATKRQLIHERAKAIYCVTNGNMGPETEMHYKSDYSTVHAAYPDAPADAVPVTPAGNYVALQTPPCYRYKNTEGKYVTACPGASFTPKYCSADGTAIVNEEDNGSFDVRREGTYMGYYNNIHALYPNAPKNAVAAWPASPYTQLQNPPCYKYRNIKGLEVTECPGAFFEPEHEYRK